MTSWSSGIRIVVILFNDRGKSVFITIRKQTRVNPQGNIEMSARPTAQEKHMETTDSKFLN